MFVGFCDSQVSFVFYESFAASFSLSVISTSLIAPLRGAPVALPCFLGVLVYLA